MWNLPFAGPFPRQSCIWMDRICLSAGEGLTYDEVMAPDKTSLDIFWLRDESLTDLDNLPEPDELVENIIENIEAALASFREINL